MPVTERPLMRLHKICIRMQRGVGASSGTHSCAPVQHKWNQLNACWKTCASTTMVSLKFPLQDPLQAVATVATTTLP